MKARKVCFVTVGATATFDSLIRATLSPSFLAALKAADYTELLLQYGRDGQYILEEFNQAHPVGSNGRHEILIEGFDFNQDGLGREMQAAKGEDNGVEGVVLSHAGITKIKFTLYRTILTDILRFWIYSTSSQHCRPPHRCTEPHSIR